MTKEPKLESAMRIIDEWRDYDDEIRRLQEQFESERETAAKVIKTPEPGEERPGKKEDEHEEL